MANKVKVDYQGREVDATPIEINQVNEYWNHYFLDDGSVIKSKSVATKVLRLDNEYDAEGNPVYLVQSTNILSVNSPETLKRKV